MAGGEGRMGVQGGTAQRGRDGAQLAAFSCAYSEGLSNCVSRACKLSFKYFMI